MDTVVISSSSDSINDIFQDFHRHLPLKTSHLNDKYDRIPGYLKSANLQKQIWSLNKRLVLQHFSDLTSQIAHLYFTEKIHNGKDLSQIMKLIVEQVIQPYKYSSEQYITALKEVSHMKVLSLFGDKEVLRTVLTKIGEAHYSNFELGNDQLNLMTMTRSPNQKNEKSIRIPQKFESIIETIINLTFPEEKSQNQVLESESDSDVKAADVNALWMRDTLVNGFIPNDANTPSPILEERITETKEKNANKIQNKALGFLQMTKDKLSGVIKGKRSSASGRQSQKSVDNHDNMYQEKVNGLLNEKIPQLQTEMKGDEKMTQAPKFLENLEALESSRISYYDTHMIAHLVDLVMNHPGSFDITLIQYNPYLHVLREAIEEEIKGLKLEAGEFEKGIAKLHEERRQSRSKSQAKKEEQKEQKEGKLFSKAFNTIKKNIKEYIKPEPTAQIQDPNKLIVQGTEQKHFVSLLNSLQSHFSLLDQLPHAHDYENNFIPKALTNFMLSMEGSFKIGYDRHCYHENQSWILIIIILYREMSQTEYTPLIRRSCIRTLKNVFCARNGFFNPSAPAFQNWPVVLKFLENNRKQILTIKTGSISAEADQILAFLTKNIHSPEKVGKNLSGIFQGGLENFKDKVPNMKLVCLSGGKRENANHCKVVHLFISGFLSEDTDKLEQWADLVDIMPDSEIYALVWESDTITNLVKFFFTSTKDMILAKKFAEEFRKKCVENPFNPAFAVAQITGRVLAELVLRIFPNRFINIIGYSLGSEVIKEFLHRMVETRKLSIVNNVYLMGGVSDVNELSSIIARSTAPLSVYNAYTKHDRVLKTLLSLCKPEVIPIGLHDIPKIAGHTITNVECTKFISGHLAFRSNLDVMGKVLNLSIG